MTNDKWIGIGFLAFGIAFLWWSIKNPVKSDITTANLKGIIAGVGFIILGVLLILGAEWK